MAVNFHVIDQCTRWNIHYILDLWKPSIRCDGLDYSAVCSPLLLWRCEWPPFYIRKVSR